MKKISCLMMVIAMTLVGALLLSTSIVIAIDQGFTLSGTSSATNQGQYIVREQLAQNNLAYGVRHFTHKAESTTTLSIGGNADGAHGKINTPFVPGQLYEQRVNIVEVPTFEGVKVVSWSNLNSHRWKLATVRSIAHDYEAKHPGWTVIAAINGDWCDPSGAGDFPYQPFGPQVSSGNYYRTTTTERHYYLGFPNDGSSNSLIPSVFVHRSPTMKLAIMDEDGNAISTFPVEGINRAPTAKETSVYYGIYQNNVYQPKAMNDSSMARFVVFSAKFAIPSAPDDFYGLGFATKKEDPHTLQVGQFGIETNNLTLVDALGNAAMIRVQWEMVNEQANSHSIIGAGARFLHQDEHVVQSVEARHPRSFIGKRPDGTIVMGVVDGRQGDVGMHGMHGSELAATMRRYGATEGFTLDGGGSSTLLIRKDGVLTLTNSPSDGFERNIANAILVVARDPKMSEVAITATPTTLSFQLDVLDAYEHDIQELYVRLGTTQVPIVNGVAIFTSLRADSEYTYTIRYKDKNNRMIDIPGINTIKTQKVPPIFRRVRMVEHVDSFVFTIDYTDRGGASNLGSAFLFVNEELFGFTDGSLTVPKEMVGDTIYEVILEYTVDLNNNDITEVIVVHPQYVATITLNTIIDDVNSIIRRIFNE